MKKSKIHSKTFEFHFPTPHTQPHTMDLDLTHDLLDLKLIKQKATQLAEFIDDLAIRVNLIAT